MALCGVCRHTAMSCSEDGSIRIWDTDKLAQKTVLKPTLRKPGRVPVTACSYSRDGGLIVAGLNDGSIQMWDVRGAQCCKESIMWSLDLVFELHLCTVWED